MNSIIIFCAVIAAVVASPEEFYNSEYDNFDIKPLLENPRTLKYYGNCFLDKGPCSPEGAEFKKAIPEAMKTVCSKCTPKQRELVRIVIHAFRTKQPEMWNELIKKLDPKGLYRAAFKNIFHETY